MASIAIYMPVYVQSFSIPPIYEVCPPTPFVQIYIHPRSLYFVQMPTHQDLVAPVAGQVCLAKSGS